VHPTPCVTGCDRSRSSPGSRRRTRARA
jgi:hypothetical protein